MIDAINPVTEWLLDASSKVGSEYMRIPMVGLEKPKYRERVYCYELYHRWRSNWNLSCPYSLSGEVDKYGHPKIRGNQKPDFLVHVPGQMDNLLVMEVKPKNASLAKMVKDLETLTEFRRALTDQDGNDDNYKYAYWWIYGTGDDWWPKLKAKVLAVIANDPDIDTSLIQCVIHTESGKQATFEAW